MLADMGKYKFTVVYGKEASYYADEHGVKETVKAFESGELNEGMYHTYELDTENDVRQLLQALDDAYGWDAYFFDFDPNTGDILFED